MANLPTIAGPPMTRSSAVHWLAAAFAVLGFVGLMGGAFFAASLAGRFSLPRQPAVRIAVLPTLVTFSDGAADLVYASKATPNANASLCNGACLLDAYDVSAAATCEAPASGPIDNWRQLFRRTIAFSDGQFSSNAIDLTWSYGVYTSVEVISWATLILTCFLFPAYFSKDRALLDNRIFRPMYDAHRAIIAALVFSAATVYGMALAGETVVDDMSASALAQALLVLLSLSLERDIGCLFSIAHNQAFDKPKDNRAHTAHAVTFFAVFRKWLIVSAAQILIASYQIVSTFNYGLADPGLVESFEFAVSYGAPYSARWYRPALASLLVVYHVIPPLIHIVPAILLMRESTWDAWGKTRPFGASVRSYVASNLTRILVVIGVIVCMFSAAFILTDGTGPPVCSS